jgi:hypothetical protein
MNNYFENIDDLKNAIDLACENLYVNGYQQLSSLLSTKSHRFFEELNIQEEDNLKTKCGKANHD